MASKQRLWIAAALVAVIALGVAAMQFMTMAPPDELDLSRAKPSAAGLYAVAIEPEGGAVVQNEMHAWVLTLKSAAGEPVTGATISVDGGMPQHGHGLPTSPVASEVGNGSYKIDGVRFNMTGWWELKFHIKAAQGEDDVTFNIAL